jgi:hypothetical protein
MTSYLNPWHKPGKPEYGPPAYETDVKPAEYRGFLIFHRLPQVWDVVKDGRCVTQRAGPNGARQFIDHMPENLFSDMREVSKAEFFTKMNPLNVHPRICGTHGDYWSDWEMLDSRRLIGRSVGHGNNFRCALA